MQYIILNGKTPTHGFKDGQGVKSYEEVKEFDNVAVVVPKGYAVLDFDTTSDAEIALKIIEALDIKTRVMRTTRGVHCWFKAPEGECKNFIKSRLALGIYCDRKSGGRNAYVKIKQDGKAREWIRKVPAEDMEVIPPYFMPVGAPSGKFEFQGMTEGSGRNQELFNYIVYLQTKGYSRDEIKEIISLINEFVFADPLPESEVATICRDEAFRPDEEIAREIAKSERRSPFDHIAIANYIIENHKLINYNGVIYEYLDGYYQPAEFLRRYVRETYEGAKNAQVNEVVGYISDMEKKKTNSIKVDPYILNLKNTRFDIRSGKCLEFTSEEYEFNRLPVVYDPSAYSADIDSMLSREFDGDKELILLFEEMLGAVLLKHSKYQKAFLFYGSGANGKSTILNLIRAFIGSENYSAIALQDVTSRFNTAELENKLANIGDDIDNKTLVDTGKLKKLFAGNAVTVEHKGEKPYVIEPYATHIYSCNAIPRSFDKSEGFYRRWIFIPLSVQFTPGSPDYDPFIEDKITTPEALSYLLNIAIRGARRLIKNGKFIEPQKVRDMLKRYKTDNSNVLSWIEDNELTIDYFLDKPKNVLYSEFCDWCKLSGVRSDRVTGKMTFYREITSKYQFDTEALQKHDGKRYFMIKID